MKGTMSLLNLVIVVLALFLLSSTTIISDNVSKCPSVHKDKETACREAIGGTRGIMYKLCINTLRSRFNGSTHELAEYAHASAQQARHSFYHTITIITGELMHNSSLSSKERAAYIGCLNETMYRNAVDCMDNIIALLPKNCTRLADKYTQADFAMSQCNKALWKLSSSPTSVLLMNFIDQIYNIVAYSLYLDLVGGDSS
ncbi:hypothetical protein ACP4OV_018444 [Aristida adscensionis]